MSDRHEVAIGEAAEILGVSIDTVRRWDREGVLHLTWCIALN
ncbi:MAG: MerR family DNA-binding transcriptional regulator [Patescibacteria group bacterium]